MAALGKPNAAIAISCSALCMVPHSGFLIVYNSVAGFSLKDTFKDAFIAINVTGWIAMIIVVIMAGLGLA